jgi:hypothetical protein
MHKNLNATPNLAESSLLSFVFFSEERKQSPTSQDGGSTRLCIKGASCVDNLENNASSKYRLTKGKTKYAVYHFWE